MKRTLIAACIAASIVAFNAPDVQAIAIQYDTKNVGEDVWQYSYSVTDFTFGENQALFIDFDSGLYIDLEEQPPTPNDAWFTLTFPTSDPTPGVDGDLIPGSFVALSLVDAPSLADPFKVTFTWLGANTPGAQPFTVFQLNEIGEVVGDPLATGTTRAVPEPATVSLLAMGAAIACGVRRRRRNS